MGVTDGNDAGHLGAGPGLAPDFQGPAQHPGPFVQGGQTQSPAGDPAGRNLGRIKSCPVVLQDNGDQAQPSLRTAMETWLAPACFEMLVKHSWKMR